MHLYGLIIGISLVVGIEYFSRHQKAIPANKINIFIFGLLISMLFGARTYHVIDSWSYYSQHLLQIFATWNGGLGIYGALIAATIYILIYSLVTKISILSILDSITPILPLCQSIGRLGNFINQEIPSWWFEASLNLFLFFLIRKSKKPTAFYLIGYGIIRFFMEFFRNDTWQVSHIKIAQIISLIFITTGIILQKNFKKSR